MYLSQLKDKHAKSNNEFCDLFIFSLMNYLFPEDNFSFSLFIKSRFIVI